MTFPYPLGKVFPGASFATISVPLTQNIQPTKKDNLGNEVPDNQFNGIFIRASNLNSGNMYVCNTAAAPDLTAYSNVIDELPPGAAFPRGKEWANNRDITALFIGATNATDFTIPALDQF